MSHLGRNPVRGGRPPRDRRIRHVRAAIVGALVQAEARVIVFVQLMLFRVRKAALVITI